MRAPRHPVHRQWIAGLAFVVVLAIACTVNPATGERQLTLIGESQEVELGRRSDEEIVRTLGLYPNQALQAYVDEIGQRLAATSERPDLPWTFRVLDDDVVNAFALPGGFVYVTRGILAHLDSEAELAGVLGHEIGHVTARHGVERLSKAQLTQLGLGLGVALEPELGRYSDLAEIGLGALFLKFSRDDERQADDLGLRYVRREGYAAREMIEVFEVLERVSRARGPEGRIPGWLSTHPTPANRIERLSGQVGEEADADVLATVARERYLGQLDGLVVGPDPRQGFFRGGTFYHPELAFRLDFPDGWQTSNQRQSVSARAPDDDALVTLALIEQPSAAAAVEAFFADTSVSPGRELDATFGGLRAEAGYFSVERSEADDLAGVVAFVEHGDEVFRILGLTLAGRLERLAPVLASSVTSFRPVTEPAILDVEPRRLDIVRLGRALTVAQFARRYPSTVDVETLARLNQADGPGAPLPAGALVKRVTGGQLPEESALPSETGTAAGGPDA